MNITVRWANYPKYANVSVSEGSATLELGLLDSNERQELADHLREVAHELSPLEEE